MRKKKTIYIRQNIPPGCGLPPGNANITRSRCSRSSRKTVQVQRTLSRYRDICKNSPDELAPNFFFILFFNEISPMIACKTWVMRCIIGCSVFYLGACTNHPTLFQKISSDHSGIYFSNLIVENDSINPMDLTNIYNGGGVGIGDFDRNGRPDIHLAGK